MHRSSAAFEAYDGVRIQMADGSVVTCPALGTGEAVRMIRALDGLTALDPVKRAQAHQEFIRAFVMRMGLGDATVEALGMEAGEFGRMKVRWLLALIEAYHVACWGDSAADRARAQVTVLARTAKVLGSSDDAASTFRKLNDVSGELYLHLYGLAQDFSSALTRSPTSQWLVLERATPERRDWTTSSSSSRA